MRAAARASLSSASACSWNASRVSSSTMRCSSAVDMRSADADGAAAADPVVRQAGGLDVVGLVQVAAVEDRRVGELLFQLIEIRAAELLPPGDHGSRAGIAQRFLGALRSEEQTSELQSLMRITYAVFCLKHKKT